MTDYQTTMTKIFLSEKMWSSSNQYALWLIYQFSGYNLNFVLELMGQQEFRHGPIPGIRVYHLAVQLGKGDRERVLYRAKELHIQLVRPRQPRV
jgi:hypothetical protein